MPKNFKWHNFRLTLRIHSIKLKVRFPCSVSTTLKIQNQEHQISTEVLLKDGEAIIQQKFTHQLNMTYNPNISQYLERKSSIVVYLKSASGKIPAGSVPIDLTKKRSGYSKTIAKIDKCPDKNATIQFTYEMDQLGESEYFQNNENFENQLQKSYNYLTNNFARNRLSPERDFKNQTQRKQDRKTFIQKKISSSTDRRFYYSPRQEDNFSGKQDNFDQYGKERSQILRRFRSNNHLNHNQKQNSVISDYFPDKNKSVQNLNKLLSLERQLEGQKDKVSFYEVQINSKKNKQLQLQKDLKILQKKHEQLEVDFKTLQSKKETAERSLKDLQSQFKISRQKFEDQQHQFQTLIKRAQFKENSYKEQLQSLSQKLSDTQSQRQRLQFEKNASALDAEQKQKINKQSIRQKQKKFSQEKYQLSRKAEQLTKQINALNEQKNQLINKNKDLSKDNKDLMAKIQSSEMEKEDMRRTCQQLKLELAKEKNNKKIIQQNLQQNTKFQQQKRQFKRVFTQKQAELNQISRIQSSLQKQLSKLKSQNANLEESLRQSKTNIKNLQRKLSEVMGQYEDLKTIQEQSARKLIDLTFQYQGDKVNYQKLEEEHVQLQFKYEQQRQSHDSQIQKLSQKISNLQKENEQLSSESFMLNQQNMNLQKQIQQMKDYFNQAKQQIEALQSQLIQLNQSNSNYQYKNIELNETKKQLQINHQEALSTRNIRIRQLQQAVQKLREQLQNSIEERKNEQNRINKLKNDMQNEIKNKEVEIRELNQSLTKLQTESVKYISLVQDSKHQLKIKINQNVFVKQQLQKYKNDYSKVQNEMFSVKRLKQNKQEECQSYREAIQHLNQEIDSKNANLKKIKDQLENYKKKNYQYIKNFCNMISNRQNPSHYTFTSKNEMNQSGSNIESSNFLSTLNNTNNNEMFSLHEQREIAMNMSETIRKNNRSFNELQSVIKIKEHSIEEYTTCLQKKLSQEEQLKEINEVQQKEINALKRQIQNLKQDLSSFQTKMLGQKEDLNKILKDKDEEINELQEKISTINGNLNEKNREIFSIKNQIQDYQNVIKSLESNLKEKNDSNKKVLEKTEKQKNKQLAELKDTLKMTQGKLKSELQKVSNLQEQYQELEKELQQEKQNNKTVMKELQTQCFNNQKLQLKLNQFTLEIQAKNNQIKKQQSTQIQLKNLVELLKAENQSLKTQNQKINVKLTKVQNESSEKDEELNQQLEKCQLKIKAQNEQIRQYESDLRQKNNEIRKNADMATMIQRQKNRKESELQEINSLFTVNKKEGQNIQLKLKALLSQNQQLKTTLSKHKELKRSSDQEANRRIAQLNQQLDGQKKRMKQYQKRFDNIQMEFQTKTKKHMRQNEQFKDQISNYDKIIQTFRNSSELIKKSLNELNSNIKNLEKQNKVSGFYFIPLKEIVKKIQSTVSAWQKQLILVNINKTRNLKDSLSNNVLNVPKLQKNEPTSTPREKVDERLKKNLKSEKQKLDQKAPEMKESLELVDSGKYGNQQGLGLNTNASSIGTGRKLVRRKIEDK